MDFAGTLSIVTGGASGIGEALAMAIAARGGQVVIADRQLELARKVAQAIVDTGGQAQAVALVSPTCTGVISFAAHSLPRLSFPALAVPLVVADLHPVEPTNNDPKCSRHVPRCDGSFSPR